MDKQGSSSESSLYRAVWRWHFVAGLLVLPFLILMAITGGIYLFKDELDHLIYRTWDEVPPHATPVLPASAIISRVQAATGSQVLQLTQPELPAEAMRMIVRTPEGEPRTAFVDPYDGRVLGTTRFGGVMQIVRKLHSLQYFGPIASWLIEIAAGWAIILVGMGIYLWWPRRKDGGVVTIRGAPRQRIFWRDLHAVTGIFTAAVILFLAVTGMPWSDVWGGKVQAWTTATGLNRPAPPAEVVPDWQLEAFVPPSAAPIGGHRHEIVKPPLPWALEKAAPPESDTNANRSPIDLDVALATFDRAALPRPYSVTLPQGPRGAYAGSYSPARIEDVRIVYVDQYDARILDDVRYERFGAGAKAIEWGIAVHQGQEYGWVNRYVMLLGCLAIVTLAISSLTMWWKRRPKGSLGVPPRPIDRKAAQGLIAIVVAVGIFYPLVGVSLVAAFVIDRAIVLFVRRRRAPV